MYLEEVHKVLDAIQEPSKLSSLVLIRVWGGPHFVRSQQEPVQVLHHNINLNTNRHDRGGCRGI